jgi:hypothetical protein
MKKSLLLTKQRNSYRPLTERNVQLAIIKYLYKEGWSTRSHLKQGGEKGVDIVVQNDVAPQRRFFIETKGDSDKKSKYSMHDANFVNALGQIVTRMKVVNAPYNYNYGIGLPERSAKIALRRIPWQFAKKLCLYIFSVDRAGKVTKYTARDMKRVQATPKKHAQRKNKT